MKKIAIDGGTLLRDDSGLLARTLYSSSEAKIIHMTLRPGAAVKPHVSPVDMEFFVLEGSGTFQLGEESAEAGAGNLLPCPRGVPHGMRNDGPGDLRVLAIKNPRPEGE